MILNYPLYMLIINNINLFDINIIYKIIYLHPINKDLYNKIYTV
jgi:hypothetical protein